MAPGVELTLVGGLSWETRESPGRRLIQSHGYAEQQQWYGTEISSGTFKKGLFEDLTGSS